MLQVTWAAAGVLEPVRAAAGAAGVAYASVHVPQALRRLALPAVIGYGAIQAARYMRRRHIPTLFPRSLIPMSMSLLLAQTAAKLDLVFDADGFMADERIDFGGWKERGTSYRALRAVEAAGVRRARSVVCRTEQARKILIQRAGASQAEKIFVAPNGKDATQFHPADAAQRHATRARYGIELDAPWLVYVGSLGPQYYPELMVEVFWRIKASLPAARFSCFTYQGATMKRLLEQRGLSSASVHHHALPPAEVPKVLAACDMGLALRKEYPSQRGVSPIKVAEYLLCGTPVVATRVGDLAAQLVDSEAALLVDAERADSAERVADWFGRSLARRERLREQARVLGERWFDLQSCIERYAEALQYGRGPT